MEFIHTGSLDLSGVGGGGKYNVVSMRDQENTVKGLFFEIKRCACAAHLGVQNWQFSIKSVLFKKSLRFCLMRNSFRG